MRYHIPFSASDAERRLLFQEIGADIAGPSGWWSELMQWADETFTGAPEVQTLLERYGDDQFETAEQVEQFMDVASWVHIFSEAPALLLDDDADIPDDIEDEYDNISEFLSGLTAQERLLIYRELISRTVPAHIRSVHADVFDPLNDDRNINEGDIVRASEVAAGILGVRERADYSGPDGVNQVAIIMDTLRSELLTTGGEPTNQTYIDYLQTMRSLNLRSLGNAAEDPAALLAEMPPSKLRGGILFGVITRDMLVSLHRKASILVEEEHRNVGEAMEQIEDLTQVTRREAIREAETMRDIYRKMSGVEKAAMIAIAIIALMNKTSRNIAIGVGAAYFGQKFLLKGEGEKLLAAISDKARDGVVTVSKQMRGGIEDSLTSDGVAERAEAATLFLTEYDYNDLDTESTALVLLSPVPLKELAMSFNMEGTDWTLNTSSRSPAMTYLRQKMRGADLPSTFMKFFKDPEKHRETSDVLSWVFYRIARQDPANEALVETVEKAWGSSPLFGPNMPQLFRANPSSEAASAYRTLVDRGKISAGKDERLFGDFMLEHVHEVQAETLASQNENAPDASDLSPDEQLFVQEMLDRDVIAEPFTPDEEWRIAQLFPSMTARQRREIVALLQEHVDHNLRPLPLDEDGILRITNLLAVLPLGTHLDRVVDHLQLPANIDLALLMSLQRDLLTHSRLRDNVQRILDRIVILQSEQLMTEVRAVPTATVAADPGYAEWVSRAEKLYMCCAHTPDGVTDVVSFLLEYLLYQGKYDDADSAGRTGTEKFRAYLDDIEYRYDLDRSLGISTEVETTSVIQFGSFSSASRLESGNHDTANTIFNTPDLLSDNMEERLRNLKESRF